MNQINLSLWLFCCRCDKLSGALRTELDSLKGDGENELGQTKMGQMLVELCHFEFGATITGLVGSVRPLQKVELGNGGA